MSAKKSPTPAARWKALQSSVIACQRCPRLNQYTREVAQVKRKAYRDHEYWGQPVPDFGSSRARLLIVGLAPGAHGANRTGRMFTGDRSGDWLYRALYKAGFANQPESVDATDGLKLKDCAITNICRCAPPGNRPQTDELAKCRPYLLETLAIIRPRVVLALGGLAWNGFLALDPIPNGFQFPTPKPKFSHGAHVDVTGQSSKSNRWLFGCYHPSQQNTFTGRLTEAMLDRVFQDIRNAL